MQRISAAAGEVLVYAFECYELASRSMQLALYKAPLSHIQAVGGRALPGTVEAVPEEVLDDQGRYRRVATGWGALN